MNVLDIESKEQLLSIRDVVFRKGLSLRYNDREKFIMFNAVNEINAKFGRGKQRDNCGACLSTIVIPQLKKWFDVYDMEELSNIHSLKDILEASKKIPSEDDKAYIKDQEDYSSLSLKDLRELFPNIKSTSKEGFIKKIEDGK